MNSQQDNPRISFIIPTKDRESILLLSLNKLLEAVVNEHIEVIIINDSARPLYLPGLSDHRVRIFQNEGKGVASARNTGAAIARANLLWFLDDDIWLNREMFVRGVMLCEHYPNGVFNFNWTYPPELEESIRHTTFGRFLIKIGFTTMKGWCRGMPWSDNSLFRTDWLAGATLLIPADVFSSVNGYNATFPLAGFEDYDFSVRIKEAGYISRIDATVCALHNEVSKTSLRGFLTRTFNNAVTRRHGVEIGYTDQKLHYSRFKSLLYNIVSSLDGVILYVFDRPSMPVILDPLTMRVFQLLIGAAVYKGYTKGAVE